MSPVRSILAVALSCAAVGCSEPEPSVGPGDVFPQLSWEGYANEEADAVSTTKAFGGYGTDQLVASGRSYALVHLSESF